MVWDLRGALLKKEERESSRLADFEFKHRVRTMRLLARKIEIDGALAVGLVARGDDEAALAELRRVQPMDETVLREAFTQSREEALAQLIRELGNPAPYKLL